jgi:hypothetical protein
MTSTTLEQVQHLAAMLTPNDKARLRDYLESELAKAPPRTTGKTSELGQQLRSIRAEIVAGGAPLLDRTRLAEEVIERRGER